MNKIAIRARMRSKRKTLTSSQVSAATDRVTNTLLHIIDWPTISTIHVYESNPAWNEIQTDGIIEFIRQHYPNVVITVVQPQRTSLFPSKQFDVILVPLLAFDGRCNRLGFGGGWYDRFLSTQVNALTIGLAYDFQHVDALPVESHDIPLAKVVTETRVYS